MPVEDLILDSVVIGDSIKAGTGARVVTVLLGAMIIAKWPASSFYVLGIFLGIDLIFFGSTWLTMGLALRKRA